MAIGFCFPVACAGWGVGVPSLALIAPSLRFFAYVISLPPIALIAVMQLQLWRATRLPEGPARQAALIGARRLFAIPFVLIAAGLLLSGGLLLAGLPKPPPPSVPLHALIVVAFVFSLIGACFLPLTARAQFYLLRQ